MSDEANIRAVIERAQKAHHDKDAAAIVARYAPDAVLFTLAPPLAHQGVNVEEKQAWLDTWEGPIGLEPRDFSITVKGDSAFCHGYYRLSGTKVDADRPIGFWMRATVYLERSGGEWKIVHEHSSVPFYMDGSLRPAFDLEP